MEHCVGSGYSTALCGSSCSSICLWLLELWQWDFSDRDMNNNREGKDCANRNVNTVTCCCEWKLDNNELDTTPDENGDCDG